MGADGHGAHAVLLAHDVLDRGEVLPRQPTMRNDHDADHALSPVQTLCPGAAASRSSSL